MASGEVRFLPGRQGRRYSPRVTSAFPSGERSALPWRQVPIGAWICARAFTAGRRGARLRAVAALPVWLGLTAAYRARGWAVSAEGACALLRPAATHSRALVTEAAALTTGAWVALLGSVGLAGRGLPRRAALLLGLILDGWFLVVPSTTSRGAALAPTGGRPRRPVGMAGGSMSSPPGPPAKALVAPCSRRCSMSPRRTARRCSWSALTRATGPSTSAAWRA
jgi:hypothetical protein